MKIEGDLINYIYQKDRIVKQVIQNYHILILNMKKLCRCVYDTLTIGKTK
jgi:hypothetical protein